MGARAPRARGLAHPDDVSSATTPAQWSGSGARLLVRLTASAMPSSRARSAARDRRRWPHHRDGLEHRVVDQPGHVVPPAFLRQPVQLRVQRPPAMALERGRVRGRRSVERELSPGHVLEPLELVVALGRHHERGAHDLHVAPRAAGGGNSPRQRGQRDLLQRLTRRERVGDEPVGHLTGDLDHAGPEAADVHRGSPERVGSRIERRDHQGVPVEVARERERLSRLPRRPDRVERPHDLAHPARRLRPRRAEAVHDVRSHLRAEPEQEAATGDQLQVVAEVGERHRVARRTRSRSQCPTAPGGCARRRPRARRTDRAWPRS